jgi:hypothetical protein
MGFSLCVRLPSQRPVKCSARMTLFASHYSLERGDLIAAGCKLREAMRQFLHAECEFWGCLPTRNFELMPMGLAKALRKAGQMDPGDFQWVSEIIGIGNRAAHVEFVQRQEIETALKFAHLFLDGSPYLVQPACGGRLG